MCFSTLFIFLLSSLSLAATERAIETHASSQLPACRPFRVHKQADLPPPPSPEIASHLQTCVAYYTHLDLNQNGRPDWTTVGGTLGDVLVPNDPDLNSNGVENIFDPHPMDLTEKKVPFALNKDGTPREIPPHLAMKDARADLQNRLYKTYGVVAVDHTDDHAAVALRDLLLIFDHVFPKNARVLFPNVRTFYAFTGHDTDVNIAAFHPEMNAISIGGRESWVEDEMTPEMELHLLAALAHELGHAFVFAHMTPDELARVGTQFGHWPSVPENERDFRQAVFLEAHPLRGLASLGSLEDGLSWHVVSQGRRSDLWSDLNVVSLYSMTNRHEWFADAFAAWVLTRLSDANTLQFKWRKLSAHTSDARDGWWVNYNHLSPEFRRWFENRIAHANTVSLPKN